MLRTALIIRGAALGLLFAPINNVAFGSLKPARRSKLRTHHLSRQLGGSFGIAVLASFVTTHNPDASRRSDQHAECRESIDAGAAAGMTATLVMHGYPPTSATQVALRLLDGQVTRQAAMLSYNDAWMLLLVAFVWCPRRSFCCARRACARTGRRRGALESRRGSARRHQWRVPRMRAIFASNAAPWSLRSRVSSPLLCGCQRSRPLCPSPQSE